MPEKPSYLTKLFPFLRHHPAPAPQPSVARPSPGSPELATFPYHSRECLLTPVELNFYRVFHAILANHYTIFTQIPISNLVYPKTGNRQANNDYRRRIVFKRVDFIICDPATLRPIAAIELDDASHAQPDRVARDTFVNQVFAAANIPLIHIPAHTNYTSADFRALHTLIPSESSSLNN